MFYDLLVSHDLSQRLCCVLLPNTFEPHDPVEISCSVFVTKQTVTLLLIEHGI